MGEDGLNERNNQQLTPAGLGVKVSDVRHAGVEPTVGGASMMSLHVNLPETKPATLARVCRCFFARLKVFDNTAHSCILIGSQVVYLVCYSLPDK